MRQNEPAPASLLPPHQAIRSVVATGGVYKGQGRIQHKLVTCDYKAFHVHGHVPAPDPQHDVVSMASPTLSGQVVPIGHVSVARVRPRTSKGITDLLLPDTSTHYSAGSPHDWARASFPDQSPHMRRTPAEGDEPPGHEGRSGRRVADANHTFWSRSLSESTRRINPRTKNGHAPPPMKS